MNKLRFWEEHPRWEEAEAAWEKGAAEIRSKNPLKQLSSLPNMKGITPKTARFLKLKSLWWILTKDHEGKVRRGFLQHPVRHLIALVRSLFRPQSFVRIGDFFLYGLEDLKAFETLLQDPDTLLVLGFSYCHKPFECPSGRFTADCIHDPLHPVCRQCFIGKAINALPPYSTEPLLIPTVHYIGGEIFRLKQKHPSKKLVFLITACELTLTMFGDWGNMVEIKGVGVRLDGRICNTMEAFALSETGIKPGLTVVLPETQQQILQWLKDRAVLKT